MIAPLKPCPFCGEYPERRNGYYEHYCTVISIKLVSAGEIAAWNTRPGEDALTAALAEMTARAEQAKKAAHWIPVTEGKPESETVVFVYDSKTNRVYEGYLSSEVGDWCENTWWLRRLMGVTHWMPKILPEPPAAREREEVDDPYSKREKDMLERQSQLEATIVRFRDALERIKTTAHYLDSPYASLDTIGAVVQEALFPIEAARGGKE